MKRLGVPLAVGPANGESWVTGARFSAPGAGTSSEHQLTAVNAGLDSPETDRVSVHSNP